MTRLTGASTGRLTVSVPPPSPAQGDDEAWWQNHQAQWPVKFVDARLGTGRDGATFVRYSFELLHQPAGYGAAPRSVHGFLARFSERN